MVPVTLNLIVSPDAAARIASRKAHVLLLPAPQLDCAAVLVVVVSSLVVSTVQVVCALALAALRHIAAPSAHKTAVRPRFARSWEAAPVRRPS
jgi:hypothetical protein